MTTRGRPRVLHSMRAPGSDTRYASHMVAIDGADFEMVFFTWHRALLGSYDIFHLHWPEQLLGDDRGLAGWIRSLRLRVLLGRLKRRRIPVVYTLHNHRPHDRESSARLNRAQKAFAALTVVEIHLVPEPEREVSVTAINIPHGDYRVPFQHYPRLPATPGRLLAFGIIKRYKGIEHLLAQFAMIDSPDVALRIVGEPADGRTVDAIETAATADRRVSREYGFVPDRQLVSEVSSARLVVLPYTELHSSGAVLVALSLDRPVLIPDSPTARALRDEVGADWVQIFSPPLTAAAILDALAIPIPPGQPDLSARLWSRVRRQHVAVYQYALASFD